MEQELARTQVQSTEAIVLESMLLMQSQFAIPNNLHCLLLFRHALEINASGLKAEWVYDAL